MVRTDKQEAFIEAYCLTGNASKAAQMAGYAEKAAKQMGHKLKNQFEFEIQEKTNQMIQAAVPGALAQLTNLVGNAQSESVKLGAIKDILDRAGYRPTEKIEQQISHMESASTDELKKELEALIGTSDVEEIPKLVN
jgi:phage terminase small subunit